MWGDSGSQRASSNEQWGEDYIFENASQACRIEDILMRLSSGSGLFHGGLTQRCHGLPSGMILLNSIHLYPVKSLRGIDAASAEVDELGLVGDRRFLVVEPQTGRFITQRTVPQMALVSTALDQARGLLVLSAEGHGEISIPLAPDPQAELRPVSVWSSTGMLAEDCGDDVSVWMERIIGCPCRLVRIGPAFHRTVQSGQDLLSFADGAPLLLASTASLRELNERISGGEGEAVPMDRFRPNLVVESSEPFAEDRWTRLEIGGIRFRNSGPCERCIMTTTDQLTGKRGKEPLKTLATFRRAPENASAVLFGINLIQETKSGRIRVGDEVSVC